MLGLSKRIIPIVVGVILLDLITKTVADRFDWSVVNTGISWGVGQNTSQYLVIGLGLVGITLVWSCFWRHLFSSKEDSFMKEVGFSLWLGGALANMIDRVLVGGVRDWIPVPFTRVYNNVADWMFFAGLCIGVWLLLKTDQTHSEAEI